MFIQVHAFGVQLLNNEFKITACGLFDVDKTLLFRVN